MQKSNVIKVIRDGNNEPVYIEVGDLSLRMYQLYIKNDTLVIRYTAKIMW